jgi:alpha-L-fucosidase
MTINDTWGYKLDDHNWKSSDELLKTYRQTVANGGHLLLNVGPDASGEIPPESARILRELGSRLTERQP